MLSEPEIPRIHPRGSVKLHPQYQQFAEAVNATMPTNVSDQHGAANRDTDTIRALLADHIGGMSERAVGQVPAWLRLGALDAWIGYCSGSSATCMHNPNIDSPAPVFTAAWKPGLVVCGPCIHLMMPRPNSLADRTCDGCGHECLGVEVGDPIHPSVSQIGSLIFQFGVCASCRDDVDSTA